MRTRTITTHYATIPGTDIEVVLPVGPTYGEEIELLASPREGGGWHLGYLVNDDNGSVEDPINDDDCGDPEYNCSYKDFCRNGNTGGGQVARDEYLHELHESGADKSRVFMVDRFEHGLCRHSLTGTGPQCQFDNAVGSGVLVLGPGIVPYTDRDGKLHTLEDIAASMLDVYTQWANGEVYCSVGFDVDETGAMVGDYDLCGGHLGYDPIEDAVYEYTSVQRPS
jgi:hypothetical protein